MSDTVRTTMHDGHVLIVELNRPAARNAFNIEMAEALAVVVETSEADAAVRVVVLMAAGEEVFSAGADLKVIASGQAGKLSTRAGGFAGLVRAARAKPWIAAVAGKALGGGLELCLACDMIVAGENASFGLPEVRRGIYAGAGGVFRLPRAVPRAIALEMIATGEPIDARRAYEIGLVNRLAPTPSVRAEALRLAHAVTLSAPRAVQESLTLARLADEESEAKLWARSREIGKRIFATEDFDEGLRAFAEKRAPVWTGRDKN